MKITKRNELTIVGITVRTSNANNQAAQDIPLLWERFMKEQVGNRIPNKKNETIYGVYTDYQSDHTEPYTLLIGYEVANLDDIPENLTVKIIPEAKYVQFTAKGDLTKDAVVSTWMEIWNSDIPRAYTCDLEVYGERAIDPTNGEAEILIATL